MDTILYWAKKTATFPAGYTAQITSYQYVHLQWGEANPTNPLSIWQLSIMMILSSKEQEWLESVVKYKVSNEKNTGAREKNENK